MSEEIVNGIDEETAVVIVLSAEIATEAEIDSENEVEIAFHLVILIAVLIVVLIRVTDHLQCVLILEVSIQETLATLAIFVILVSILVISGKIYGS